MNNFLNIRASKKHPAIKNNPKDISLPIKKPFNKPKKNYSNRKKQKQINNNKENIQKNILTDIGNLTVRNDMNEIKLEKPSKNIINRIRKEVLKNIKKPKCPKNTIQYNSNNNNNYNVVKLQKRIIPQQNKNQKKIISSIPLFNNYIQKTFSSQNTNKGEMNKTRLYKVKRTFSIWEHPNNKTFEINNHISKRNSIIINDNYETERNFPKQEKNKSADVSPNKMKKIIKNKKNLCPGNIKNVKNKSMIVRQIKKKDIKVGVIKLSINDYNDKDKNKNNFKNYENEKLKINLNTEKNVNSSLKTIIFNKNPQIVEEYFDEIYKYLKNIENSDLPKENYMKNTQKEITEKMRTILVDWLVDVHAKFKLFPETLFLTINIIDRYLSKSSINKKYLQLLGITSMFIAGKYEDIYPPDMKEYLFMTNNTYGKEELIRLESDILDKIEFNMTYPTSLRFLEIYKKIINLKEIDFYRCRYFIEIALLDYNCCHFSPSLIAGTSIFLNFILNNLKNKEIKYSQNKIFKQIDYDIKEIRPCLNSLIQAIKSMIDPSYKYTAIKRKFEKDGLMKVSKEKIDIDHIIDNKYFI